MADRKFQYKRFVVLMVRDCITLLAQDSCFPGKKTYLSYSNELVEELRLISRLLDY